MMYSNKFKTKKPCPNCKRTLYWNFTKRVWEHKPAQFIGKKKCNYKNIPNHGH